MPDTAPTHSWTLADFTVVTGEGEFNMQDISDSGDLVRQDVLIDNVRCNYCGSHRPWQYADQDRPRIQDISFTTAHDCPNAPPDPVNPGDGGGNGDPGEGGGE